MRWVEDRIRLARLRAGRWAAGPLLVRAMLLVAGGTTLALAMPRPLLLGRGLPLVLGLAVVVAVAPRGRLVSALLLTALVSWLVSSIGYQEAVTLARLLGLAYVEHQARL